MNVNNLHKMAPNLQLSISSAILPLRHNVIHTPVSLRTRIGYGLGHVFNDISSSLVLSYLLLYMDTVLKLEKYQCGLLILIGQIADAVCNPLFGYLSDRSDNVGIFKFGKRKIWHLFGTILLVFTFPLSFLNLNMSFASYIICYIIFQFGWAAVQNSHLALIPELSSTLSGRLKLTSIRYCATVLSNILVYGVAWYILDGNKKYTVQNVSDNFRNIMVICCCVGVTATVLFYTLVKERDRIVPNSVCIESKGSIHSILTDVIYYKTAVVYMATMVFANIGQVIMPLYLNNTLEMHGSNLAIIPLCIYMGSLVMSLCINRLILIYGRVSLYSVGSFTGFACCIWIYSRSGIPNFIVAEIYIVAILFGIASCILQVTNLGTVADVIGANIEDSALVYGFMTCTDKISNGIAIAVIEALYKQIPSKMYYGNALSLVCGCAVILATPFMVMLSRTLNRRGMYAQII